MSKKVRTPKWRFVADSAFLEIQENVFTRRRLNKLCRLVMQEKIRYIKNHDYCPALIVNIQPYHYAISSKDQTGNLRSGRAAEVHAPNA